jgi:hypothetical protein
METLIEEKVKEFTEKVNNFKSMELGSDEHLDQINHHRKPIVTLTILLANLNKNLSGFYNSEKIISSTDMKVLEKLVSINAHLFAAIRKSKHYSYIKEALSQFNEERKITKEIVHDFKEFRTLNIDLQELQKKLKSI